MGSRSVKVWIVSQGRKQTIGKTRRPIRTILIVQPSMEQAMASAIDHADYLAKELNASPRRQHQKLWFVGEKYIIIEEWTIGIGRR